MAETPINPDPAGAECPADAQPTASGPAEPAAAETDWSPAAESAAAEPAAAEPSPAAESVQPADAVAAEALPESVQEPAPCEPAAAVLIETMVSEVRTEVTKERQEPLPEPGVAASYEVPPLEGASVAEDGEWELLKAKLSDWFEGGELQRQWNRLQGPLRGLALVIGLVLLLRLYSGVIGTIDSLPLVPGLLELVGVIAFLRFCLTRLVRTSERERLLADWSRRWQEFRGRG
ncbi:MAG: CAAD domain-containing protein [Synechococcaceae cyanobacterium]|nr:CAAD domain-containing protein [Synechococcaceae cyanobacterium]